MKKKNSRVFIFTKPDGETVRVVGAGKTACCMRAFGYRVPKAIAMGLIREGPIEIK